MSWQSVFFSSNGRIGPKDFWIAALILFCLGVVSSMLHLLAVIIGMVLAYCWICILSKRLHDSGRSGWLVLVPFAIWFAAWCVALVLGGAALIAAFASCHYDAPSAAVLWGSLGLGVMLFGLAGLVNLIFLLWVGFGPADAGDNRYGPPPSPWLSPAQPPAPAA